jgi:hypothetical protein
MRQRKRLHAISVAFSYYAGAVWLVIPAAKAFFGPNAGVPGGIAIWLCGAALLSVPYALLWASKSRSIGLRCVTAVLMSVPPPLGLIGVASPLTAAGLLFPGTAWFGLAATLAAISTLAIRPKAAVITVATLAITSNLIYPGTRNPPADWEAVNTNFGDVGRSAASELSAVEFIQHRALASHARVIIFPETLVPRWTQATDLFWKPTIGRLAAQGKTVLIGTTFDILSQPGSDNGLVARGAQSGTFLQHIPVPIAMWNPLTPSSVPLHLLTPPIISIGNRRVAILICYEQLLTWPVLNAAVSNPNLLVGIANGRWTSRQVRAVQEQVFRLWSRLFSLPAITATNL